MMRRSGDTVFSNLFVQNSVLDLGVVANCIRIDLNLI